MNVPIRKLIPSLWVAVAGLAAGCHEPRHPAAPAAALPPAKVRTAEAAVGVHRATEEVVGTVRSRASASIEAKVVGRVIRLDAAPGARVKAGDVLVELDAAEMRARAEQAVAVAQQAGRDFDRIAALLKTEAVTRAEYDAAEARLRVARAAQQEAETLLGYVRIVAPFPGMITRKRVEVGDLAAPGRALVEMEDPDALRFEADVAASLLGQVHLGDRLRVSLESGASSLEAVVSEIEPNAHPVTRTFRVKLDLPAGSGARTGAFGRVGIPSAESPVLAVPSPAVRIRGQMEQVYVVAGGRAALRLVKTGKRLGDRVEILSGLEPGERVVVEGAASLSDGQPVEML